MAAGAGGVSFRTPYLAWSYAPQDEQRFRKVLGRILLGALIACVAFTLLPRPKEERVVQEVPPRLAKLLLERDNVPPPAVKPVPPKADPAQQRKAENDTTATPESGLAVRGAVLELTESLDTRIKRIVVTSSRIPFAGDYRDALR